MKYIPIWTLSLLLLFSCAQKSDKQNQVKKALLATEVSEQEFNITARFNWYEMKDGAPYSLEFEIDSGGIIYFEDCEMNNLDFVVKLNESETNESNIGWGINEDLSLLEFNITYTNKKQPNYLNDSIPLYAIKKIALDTMARNNDTDIKKEAPDNTIRKTETYFLAKGEIALRAKFINFVLGDAVHIGFEKESGEVISFGGSIPGDFGIELDIGDPAVNSENQGWVADPEILGKWFRLTYFEEKRPQYIDGPWGSVYIIKTAFLDEEKDKKWIYVEEEAEDEIVEVGMIEKIEKGRGYPFFVFTVNFVERKVRIDFSLNVEEMTIDERRLPYLVGKEATFYYTSSESKNNVNDLQVDGKSMFGPMIDTRQSGTIRHVKDGVYPFVVLTVDIGTDFDIKYHLNKENMTLDSNGLPDLVGKYAIFYYTWEYIEEKNTYYYEITLFILSE